MIFDFFKKKNKERDYFFYSNLDAKFYPKYLMEIFKQKMGYSFNIKKPRTINEYVQYLKLYDNDKRKSLLTDKTQVTEYVAQTLGTTKYNKEVYGIYDSLYDVDFNKLPKRFIIKMNNSSKQNFPILDKTLISTNYWYNLCLAIEKLKQINFAFQNGFEMQYLNIPSKIIIERLYPRVQEYQFLCVNGRVVCMLFLDEKHKIFNKLFHVDENEQVIEYISCIDKIQEMLNVAKILAKDFNFVRVDFMLINEDDIFFQELTFTPYSGFATDIEEFNSKEFFYKKCLLKV